MRRSRASPARTCPCRTLPIWKSSHCPRSPRWSRRRKPCVTAKRTGGKSKLMPINILMPALSPTMEKGNLAKWLMKEGEAVKTGDVIAEIETDKATMEYEAIDDGVIAKIVVPEGTNDVPVNQLIAVMAQEGEDPKAAADAAQKSAPAKTEAPASAPQPAPSAPPPPPQAGGGEKKAEPAPTKPSPLGGDGRGGEAARGEGDALTTNGHAPNRVFSSPLARRLAKDAGIDLGRIAGSGPHG